MKIINSLLGVSLLMLASCADDDILPTGNGDYVVVDKSATLDLTKNYQTIEGFGASDCWMAAHVGKYWTSQREEVARLLFSKTEGAGLSIWRTNLGAGSAEQGDASGITEVLRRAESYLSADGTPDWNKCEGQRYFLDKAKEAGCERVVLFSNSPLVQYTLNGQARSDRGGSANLKPECYDDFADYMAEVAARYKSQGIPVSQISPVNEPQYNWDGTGQEGSGWQNGEIYRIAEELNRSLEEKNLTDVKILLPEAGNWNYLTRPVDDANRSDQLKTFFDPTSSLYVGNLPRVEKCMAAHSYWTDGSWDAMRNVRKSVADMARNYNVQLAQTEWSMLGDHYSSEFPGYGLASEMDIALYMSKVIHNDLVMANVTSWSFWTSMDVDRFGWKNRFLLIKLHPADETFHTEGTISATPSLWVLGNYSRFITPGYRRVELNIPYESRNFFGSAWVSPQGDKVVEVYTNLSMKAVRLNKTNEGGTLTPLMKYTTDGMSPLAEQTLAPDQAVEIAPKSVTTVIYSLN